MPPTRLYKCSVCSHEERRNLFTVPTDPEASFKWRLSLGLPLHGPIPTSFRVCRNHFLDSELYLPPRAIRRRTCPGAVPLLPRPCPPPQVPVSPSMKELVKSNTTIPSRCECQNAQECGPFYTQLISGRDLASIRAEMEARTGITGPLLRIEVAEYYDDEYSKSPCVLIGEVIERQGELLLLVVKRRPGHVCDQSYIGLALLLHDVLSKPRGQAFYDQLCQVTPHGKHSERPCSSADGCTCSNGGLNWYFGCGWISRLAGTGCCKWRGATGEPKRFQLEPNHLRDPRNLTPERRHALEQSLALVINTLADVAGNVVRTCTPQAFANMVCQLPEASACRVGSSGHRPFSSSTMVADFSAHQHVDKNNNRNSITAIVNLCRPEDEEVDGHLPSRQCHVLPHYGLMNGAGHGGLAIPMTSSSVFMDVAKEEVHCSSRVEHPNQHRPSRIGLVYYIHHNLNLPDHGR